ncbi:MAG TPA: hypothetical protein DDW52_09180 [Planctomycetaceae bacterium]|nr:hypothetical protein [Planctomycetaceae bacterium]
MTKLISESVLGYLDSLEQSLNMTPESSRLIIEEVREDLRAHVKSHVHRGLDEEQAVFAALKEMGPPEELAKQMRAVIAPQSNTQIRWLRRIGGIVFVLFAFWMSWHLRAWNYGTSWKLLLGITSVSLPVFLLIWPDVIWRRNWMFSAIPTVVALFLGAMVLTLGQSSTQDISLATPELSISLDVQRYMLLTIFSAQTTFLLAMVQRRRQRIASVVLTAMVVAAIELPFVLEEQYHALRLEDARNRLEAIKVEDGEYPTDQELQTDEFPGFRYVVNDGEYSLMWNRWLCQHFALGYSSDGRPMWVLD